MRKPFTKAGPGRPKGLQNKATVACKEALQAAFDGIGGVPALIEWAQQDKNRGQFYQLFSKLLPVQITGEGGGPVQIQVTPAQANIA